MCVICYKDSVAKLPSKARLREMWEANPDGAGIMWRRKDDGKVEWQKGFMSFRKFKKFFNRNYSMLNDTEVAFHFRITTHGGTCPENTHPFPVISDGLGVHDLHGVAECVMMHNGILQVKPREKDISDSGELALRLSKLGTSEKVFASMDCLNEELTGNRILIMGRGMTSSYGDVFKSVKGEDDGLVYSNLSFVDYEYFYGYEYGGGYRYHDYGCGSGGSRSARTTKTRGFVEETLPIDWDDESLAEYYGMTMDEYYEYMGLPYGSSKDIPEVKKGVNP